jgi:hypothetical protein
VAVSKKRLTDLMIFFEEQRATLVKRADSAAGKDSGWMAPPEAQLKALRIRALKWEDDCCTGVSERGYQLLECETVTKGPSILGVAGGKVIEVPHGDEIPPQVVRMQEKGDIYGVTDAVYHQRVADSRVAAGMRGAAAGGLED